MVLSDKDIKTLIQKNLLIIDPLEPKNIQGASVDFRISDNFLEIESSNKNLIDFKEELKYKLIQSDEIIIPSKGFILGTTLEYIKLPDDVASLVLGRSSIGRLGLFIQNAGWIDPGFEGQITLELYNAGPLPIKLSKHMRIGQFIFFKMTSKAENSYKGKYQKQKNTVGSRIHLDQDV